MTPWTLDTLPTARDQSLDASLLRAEAFKRAILAIPVGKVSSYGDVAARAGYPRHHRGVARLLRQDQGDMLPWHRVVGADGELKTSGISAKEQRLRLQLEGVKILGNRVDPSAFYRERSSSDDE